MNKKFLSAILFGAFLASSTGTFVSCKDYDDDIDRIDTELSDLKSQLAALQTEVTNGNWVTNLAPVDGGFTVTFKNGSSYTIVSGKDGEKGETGAAGKDGKGTEVKITEDGYWEIDGKKTEYVAVTKDDLNEVKVPYVNGANMWVFYDKEGKEVVSNYNANGAAYAVNTNGVWSLNIPDASGELQTIVLPTAASMISEIEFLNEEFKNVQADNSIKLLYWKADPTTDWKGPRGNIAANTTTYSTDESNSTLYTRIAPSSVDASELDFKLIDTKDNQAAITLTASRYEDLLSRAAENGLYSVTVVPGSYANGGVADKLANQFKAGNFERAMALKPATANYRSLFNIKVETELQTKAPLGNIRFGETSITAVATDLKTTPDVYRQIKVGQSVYVSVEKEYNLYDMYLTASPEHIALFGLVFSEDGRTFKATKSPDNVTDATIDLMVYTLSNMGGKDVCTTIRVEINRTLGEAVYEKQTKQPTKVDDTFLVSADKLKASLGSDLNAWYASVKVDKDNGVSCSIYDNEACTIPSDLASGQLKVVMSENAEDAVAEANIATKLNYLKFQLNINKTTKPLKIGKTYYAKLSFTDRNSGKELNHVVVPFELTKPELSTILVKESGVFLNGDLAHAYMYHGDAKDKVKDKDYYSSRYYIDRAFTDMAQKLADAKMVTTPKFTANDDAGNVLDAEGKDTGKKTSELAEPSEGAPSETVRPYVKIKEYYKNGQRYVPGYKKDLNIKFEGYYLDVNEASWKYTKNYQFRIMSPILEGEAIAANNLVEVSATGKTKLYKEDIWAKTYNNDVKYDIFKKDKDKWYREDIMAVTFSTGNKNVFEVTVGVPTDPVPAATGVAAVDSYIEVEGVSANTAKLNVAVKDIWGYTLESQVDIKTTLNTNK